ncbi:hypothetical protein IEQ34_013956 [Dendrobium chrysotoxum]|uniref:Uncharacterized protein n=1 Tax=Dendrobium chrysotoxum TaxID=161865 RepID=A0AAV7GK77_DENCH|nr:hypothetical protein IEQ34_013956 [Dendrobium chrysotoxum]
MKKKLEKLRENHPKIQTVVFAANQAQIRDQNPERLEEAVQKLDKVSAPSSFRQRKARTEGAGG